MLKKLVVSIMLLLVLVSCNSNNDKEETTTICEIDSMQIYSMQNADIQIDGNRTIILTAIGDHIVVMDEINRLDIEGYSELLGMEKEEFLRWWEEDEKFVREVFDDTTEMSLSGITAEILDVTNEYFIMRIIHKFNEMSLEELELFTGQSVSFVSLNETIEGIEYYEEGICVQQ